MYKNIGRKIKILATISFWAGAVAAIIIGLSFLTDLGFEDGWWAIFIILLGPIISWISSWTLYGFGVLIEKVCSIEQYASEVNSKMNVLESVQPAIPKATSNDWHNAERDIDANEQAKRFIQEVDLEALKESKYKTINCPQCHKTLCFDKNTTQAVCLYCGEAITISPKN